MVDKTFTYKGKTLEELKQLDMREFSKLLTSRKRRVFNRSMFKRAEPLLSKIKAANQGNRKKPIKTHMRTMIVLPEMVGLTIGIHNGKDFQEVIISEEMVGLYLGEFVQTRKRLTHGTAGVGATKSSTSSASKAK